MNLEFDNQTLLYIIICICVIQFFIMRYYVLNTIEQENKKNNRRLIKKVSKQINTTFDEYIGVSNNGNTMSQLQPEQETNQHHINQNNADIDSIDDPVDELEE